MPPKSPLTGGDFVLPFLLETHIHLKMNNKENGAIEVMIGLSKIN